jgi:hypothetical protein
MLHLENLCRSRLASNRLGGLSLSGSKIRPS